MSQTSGIFIANKASFSDVPRPTGNNLSYFLNRFDGDSLWAMRSNRSVFPIGAYLSFNVTLTPAQIFTLSTVPVEVVPAVGPGRAIQVISASSQLIFNTTGYFGIGLAFQLFASSIVPNTGGFGPQFDTQPGQLNSASDSFVMMVPNLTGTEKSISEGDSLVIYGTNPASLGDSPVKISGIYRIVNSL